MTTKLEGGIVGVTNPVFDIFPIEIWADGNCQKLEHL